MYQQIVKSKIVSQKVSKSDYGNIQFDDYIPINLIHEDINSSTGLMLMIHGMGSDFHEHDDIAKKFTSLFNVVCLQVQDRCAGKKCPYMPTDLGKYQTIDCLNAVNWVINNYHLDLKRIYVWGGSGGGHMALLSIIYAPNLFAGCVSHAPFTKATLPGEIANEWQDGWIKLCIPVGKIPNEEIEIRSPVMLANKIKTPLMLIHGDADETVSVTHSRILSSKLKELNNRSFKYHEIPGGTHNLSRAQSSTLDTRFKATTVFASELLLSSKKNITFSKHNVPITDYYHVSVDKNGYFSLHSNIKSTLNNLR